MLDTPAVRQKNAWANKAFASIGIMALTEMKTQ